MADQSAPAAAEPAISIVVPVKDEADNVGPLVEEIAAAVVYLASDGAASVTGVTLPVDGGLTAV